MSQHVVPKRTYLVVFACLIVLTLVTATVATIDLGPLNIVVALLIAMCKASLVVLFFMHLRWSTRLVHIVAVASLFWLAILISLTLSDYRTRHWMSSPETWETSSQP
ncbi:MAG: cytochrome C oxidase subunit IV family protein [Acidobacteria bacterium]|nr:cytochrome C oxidase subunit IV family protein [Acidobacteriota bacterium]